MLSPSPVKSYSRKLRDVATFLNKLSQHGWMGQRPWKKPKGAYTTLVLRLIPVDQPTFNPHRDTSFCNKYQLTQRPTTCQHAENKNEHLSHIPSLNCFEESLMMQELSMITAEQGSHTHELTAVSVHETSRGKVPACVGRSHEVPPLA